MRRMMIGALVVAALASVVPARAGLFEDIYRGLELLATPSGFPLQNIGDGTRVNGERQGRLRIVPDRVGRGYTLELDRTFGGDSRGRPEVLDLGPWEMELRGATQATLGFTRRGLLIGNANLAANNLDYSLRGKSGVQDVELTGRLAMRGALEINQLGFYTIDLNVNNQNSQLLVDGVVATGNNNTNFDIGPISVKGNVFVDAAIALLGAVGLDTSALEQLTPKSAIDRVVDELATRFPPPELVAGVNATAPPPALAMLTGPMRAEEAAQVGPPTPAADAIPEPGTLLLLGLGSLGLLWRCRR